MINAFAAFGAPEVPASDLLALKSNRIRVFYMDSFCVFNRVLCVFVFCSRRMRRNQ